MCPRYSWSLLLAGAFGIPLLAAPVHAADADESSLWQLRLEVLRLEAHQAVLQSELDLLPKTRPAGSSADGMNEELKKYLTGFLKKSKHLAAKRQESEKSVNKLLVEVGKESAELTEACRKTWQRNLDIRQRTAVLEDSFECRLGEPPPYLSSGTLAHLALWGGLAFLGVLLLVRQRLKQRESPRALVLVSGFLLASVVLVMLAGAGWLVAFKEATALLPWARANPAAIRAGVCDNYRQEQETDKSSLEEEIDSLQQQLTKARRKLDESRAGSAHIDPGTLGVLEGAVHDKMRDLLVQVRLNQKIGEEESDSREDTRKREELISEEENKYSDRLQERGWVRAGLCLLILAVASLPLVAVSFSGRSRKTRWRCPCCENASLPQPPPAGGQNDPPRLICPQCKYWAPPRCLSLPRCVSRSWGEGGAARRTGWSSSSTRSAHPTSPPILTWSAWTPPPPQPSARRQRPVAHPRRPAPTLYSDDRVPDPLLFLFREPGRDEPEALVHLFDCSGDMAILPGTSPARGRALRMDGFLVYLDVTQPWPRQKAFLDDFVADLRKELGIRAGRALPKPLAVCLSRLDLLPARRDIGQEAFPWLLDLPATRRSRINLDLLEDRSRRIEQQLPRLFPGSDLVQQLKRDFGDNHLFFPMTPVGLEGGSTDEGAVGLRDRSLVPFGIVEPVLWLLFKHGYSVFD